MNLELFGEEKENGSISYGALEKANKGPYLLIKFQKYHLIFNQKF